MADRTKGLPEDLKKLYQAFSEEIERLFEALIAGDIDLLDWILGMENALAKHITAAYLTGANVAELSKVAKMRVTKAINNQLTYFKGFSDDLEMSFKVADLAGYTPENWQIDESGIPWRRYRARSQMYTNSVVPVYFQGATEGLPLPAMPGDDSTTCQGNCRCTWRVVALPGDDMSKPDGWEGNYDAYWVTNPKAEHCFPAGTLIDTPSGQKRIEAIRVGDLVQTLNGYHRVTKLFRNKFTGDLITVRAGTKVVDCTPNHPFLTQRGWIRADRLRCGDQVMFLKNGNQVIPVDITLPNSDNRIPAGRKIGVLRPVTGLLFALPNGKRLESGVAMPILTIGLNDNITDSDVYNKLGLDEVRGFVGNRQFIQNLAQLDFKSAWIESLKLCFSLREFILAISPHGGILFPNLQHLIERFLIAHGIGLGHPLTGNGIDQSPLSIFINCKMQLISLIPNHFEREAKGLADCLTPIFGIMLDQIVNTVFSPDFRRVFELQRFFFRRAFGTVGAIATDNPAVLGSYAFWDAGSSIKDAPAKFTSEWPFGSPHPVIINPVTTSDQIVYNLEVEEEHNYIANGFVVHNCQTCLERGRNWNPLKIRGFELILPDYHITTLERASLTAAIQEALKGGKGSGNFGHAGRPGKIGGSAGENRESTYNPQNPTASPEFRAWFEGSQVTNFRGGPLVVYRGDGPNKQVFTGSGGGKNSGNIFFTNKPDIGRFYTKYGSRQVRPDVKDISESDGLYRVYLAIKNPLVLDARGGGWASVPIPKALMPKFNGCAEMQIDDLATHTRALGYDGLIVKNVMDQAGPGIQYVVFSSSQIKSIHNRGTFDAKDPNILKEALVAALKGGEGSGNYDHAGIPGHQGGSAPAGKKWIPDAQVDRLTRKMKFTITDTAPQSGQSVLLPDGKFAWNQDNRYRPHTLIYSALILKNQEQFWGGIISFARGALKDPEVENSNLEDKAQEKLDALSVESRGDEITFKGQLRADKAHVNQLVRRARRAIANGSIDVSGKEAIWFDIGGRRFFIDAKEIDSVAGVTESSDNNYEWMVVTKGGAGSGNWNHAGRPGKLGGSAPATSPHQEKLPGVSLGPKVPVPPRELTPEEQEQQEIDNDDLELIRSFGGKLRSKTDLTQVFTTDYSAPNGYVELKHHRAVMLPDGQFYYLSKKSANYHTPTYAAYVLTHKGEFEKDERVIRAARAIFENRSVEYATMEEYVKNAIGALSMEESIDRRGFGPGLHPTLIIETLEDADVGDMNRALKTIQRAVKRGGIPTNRYTEIILHGSNHMVRIPMAEIEDVGSIRVLDGQWETRLKGGRGSGNFGHAGRPGKIGGSAAQASYSKQISDPDFPAWFQDSKVVDESGKPLVVFHGTGHGGFEQFDPGKQDPEALYGPGFYFTQDPEIASSYAKSQGYEYELGRDLTDEDYEKGRQFLLDAILGKDTPAAVSRGLSWASSVHRNYRYLISNLLTGSVDWPREHESLIGFGDDLSKALNVKRTPLPGAQVIPVFLKITRPLDMDKTYHRQDLDDIARVLDYQASLHDGPEREHRSRFARYFRQKGRLTGEKIWNTLLKYGDKEVTQGVLKGAGFDGIAHTGGAIHKSKRHQVWIAFNPNQIKSAIPNQGTYNPFSGNILKEHIINAFKGGPGSGNFGHAGRPGKHGGSLPTKSPFGHLPAEDQARLAKIGYKEASSYNLAGREQYGEWYNSPTFVIFPDGRTAYGEEGEIKKPLRHTQIYAAYVVAHPQDYQDKRFWNEEAKDWSTKTVLEGARQILDEGIDENEALEKQVMEDCGALSIERRDFSGASTGKMYTVAQVKGIGSFGKPSESTPAKTMQMVKQVRRLYLADQFPDVDYVRLLIPASIPLIKLPLIDQISHVQKLDDFSQDVIFKERTKGGPGSGNFSHAGRPGHVGGSAPKNGNIPADSRDANFKRWFGDSKVRNWDGTPKVLYHGTPHAGFTEFRTDLTEDIKLAYGAGVYLTENPAVASGYTRPGGSPGNRVGEETGRAVYPVYARIENPFDLDAQYELAEARRILGDDNKYLNEALETDPDPDFTAQLNAEWDELASFTAYPEIVTEHEDVDPDDYEFGTEDEEYIQDVKDAVAHDVKYAERRMDEISKALEDARPHSFSGREIFEWLYKSDYDWWDMQSEAQLIGGDTSGFSAMTNANHHLAELGYDGSKHVEYYNPGGKRTAHQVWVAFDPKQVKSATGNSGAFNPTSADILKEHIINAFKGGPGSGNFNHAGRPGKVGGSQPGEKVGFMRRGSKYSALEAQADAWYQGLDAYQKQALTNWGRSSSLIRAVQNGKLEKYQKSGDVSPYEVLSATQSAALIESALKTAPRFPGVVYRGLSGVPGSVIREWVQSGEISLDSMQSSTPKLDTAKKWATGNYGEGAVIMRINQKSGALVAGNTNVTEFSSGADDYVGLDEQEVILPKGATYKVKSIQVYPRTGGGKRRRVSLARVMAEQQAEAESHEKITDFQYESGALYKVPSQRIYGPKEIVERKPWGDPSWHQASVLAANYMRQREGEILAEIRAGRWPEGKYWQRPPFMIINLEEA